MIDFGRELKHQKINRKFIIRTKKCYTETDSVNDRPRSGCPKSATTKGRNRQEGEETNSPKSEP